MSDQKSVKLGAVAITTGEMKLLKKLSNFTRENLLEKNERTMSRKKNYETFRRLSADCILDRPVADDTDDGDAAGADRERFGGPGKGLFPLNKLQTSKIKRRPTLTGFESNTAIEEKRNCFLELASDSTVVKIEEQFTLKMLEDLKIDFGDYGNDGVNQEDFKKILKKHCSKICKKDSDIEGFFQRVDCFSYGRVTWNAISNYMQLVYHKVSYGKDKEHKSFFKLPAKCRASPHREAVVRILELRDEAVRRDLSDSFACCSKEGLVSFWSLDGLRLKKSKRLVPLNSYKQKWVTDFAIMFQFYKIILCTGYTGEDSCILSFGDLEGCVTAMILTTVRDSLRSWKRALKESGIPSVTIDKALDPPYVQFYRWKVHLDWVQQVRYSPELRQIISCSENEKTALVIGCVGDKTQGSHSGKRNSAASSRFRESSANLLTARVRPRPEQTAFVVNKGVKCFGVSKARNYIVTAGMDRNVRIWNPYVPAKPLSTLKSHEAPIVHLSISDEEGKMFTISLDKCIFVWDLLNHCPLLSCRPRSHRISGDIQACRYSLAGRCFLIATDTISVVRQRFTPFKNSSVSTTHRSPVHAIVYSHIHRQLISACESSVIKVWDICSGLELFQFDASEEGHLITCLALDNTCRRLFTGSSSGSICMWNHNNGELLRTLSPGPKFTGEIVDMSYVLSNECRYLVSVGWSKQVTVYLDDTREFKQFMQPLFHWPDDLAYGHEDDIVSLTFCRCNLLVTSSSDGLIIVWNFVSGHKICSLTMPSDEQNENLLIEKWGSERLLEGRITKLKKRHQDLDAKHEEVDDNDDHHGGCDESREVEEMIPRVLLLTTRCNEPLSGNLVSLGPGGRVHFWNVHKSSGRHLDSFRALDKHSQASLMVVANDPTDRIMVLGDSHGFVYMWDISRFRVARGSPSNRILLAKWRAHVSKVTCIQLVEESHGLYVVTSSVDGCVRMWNDSGHFIGTFVDKGQWVLSDPSTYIHPRVPNDVLTHPLSLPIHPMIPSQRLTVEQVIYGRGYDDDDDDDDDGNDGKSNNHEKRLWNSMGKKRRGETIHDNGSKGFVTVADATDQNSPGQRADSTPLEMDDLICRTLNNPGFMSANGMRLRYEKTKPNPINTGKMSIYAHLKVHDLEPEPTKVLKMFKKTKRSNSLGWFSMNN